MNNFGMQAEKLTINPIETSTSFSTICNNGKNYQPRTNNFETETQSNISQPNTDDRSLYKRFRSFLSLIELEIVSLAITFALGITSVSSTSLILNKSCTVHSGHSTEICGNLQNYSTIKSSVEKVAANFQLARVLLMTVPAVFVTIFFMPWSDIYSRKFPLLLAIAGAAIDAFAGALCSYNLHWGLEYYFIGTLFMGLFGGSILLTAVQYSLISDVSSIDQRTNKFALYEISVGLGLCLSVVSGGWIYDLIGYTAVFSISVICFAFVFLWVAFLVQESRGIGNKDNWQTKATSLFSFQMLAVGFQAVSKKLPNNGRLVVFLAIISMCINFAALTAHFDIIYLFVHHQFDWSISNYSDFLSLYLGLSFLVMLLLRPLMQLFKFSDGLIAMLGCASFILKFTLLGLAFNTSILHIAFVLGIWIFLANCGLRTHVSKLVSENDLGKVFSIVSIAEGVAPLVGSVFLTQLFNLFLDIYAGTPFLLLSIALLFPFSVSVWISGICTGRPAISKKEQKQETQM